MKLLYNFGQYDEDEFVLLRAPFEFAEAIGSILQAELVAHGNDFICDVSHKEADITELLQKKMTPISEVNTKEELDTLIDKLWQESEKQRKEMESFRGSGYFPQYELKKEDFRETFLNNRKNTICRNKRIQTLINDITKFSKISEGI